MYIYDCLTDVCKRERENHVKDIVFSIRYWMTEYYFRGKETHFTVLETK